MRCADIEQFVNGVENLLGLNRWNTYAQLHVSRARRTFKAQLERIRAGVEIRRKGDLQVIRRAGRALDRLRNNDALVVAGSVRIRINGRPHVQATTPDSGIDANGNTRHVALKFNVEAVIAVAVHDNRSGAKQRLECGGQFAPHSRVCQRHAAAALGAGSGCFAVICEGICAFTERRPCPVRCGQLKARVAGSVKIKSEGNHTLGTFWQHIQTMNGACSSGCFLGHKVRAPVIAIRRIVRLDHDQIGDCDALSDACQCDFKVGRDRACDFDRAESEQRLQALCQFGTPNPRAVSRVNADGGCRAVVAKAVIANAGFASRICHLGHDQSKAAAFFDAALNDLLDRRGSTVPQCRDNLCRLRSLNA